MTYDDLIETTRYMWGEGPLIFLTKIKGIYEAETARHGGYLVDINIHPELKDYGEKTRVSSIRAFEEDYEALKVLWLFPEFIHDIKASKEWLTAERVIKYDENDNFISDFPKRNILDEEHERENLKEDIIEQ